MKNNPSFDNAPLEVVHYFVTQRTGTDCPQWGFVVKDCSGAVRTIRADCDAWRLSVYTETFDGNLIQRESMFYHAFQNVETWRPRYCSIPELLGDSLVLPTQMLLAWALLDIDVDATTAALAAGVDLSQPVLENYYAMDLLSLAVSSRLHQALRFFQGNVKDSIQCTELKSLDGSDYVARARRIRSILQEAGALDFASFRSALGNGHLHLAKAGLIAGNPLDSQSPDGLTPLVEAILNKDLRTLRWLLHEGADCGAYSVVPDWMGIKAPDSFAVMWGDRVFISPLAAACAADSPEAFRILLDEAAPCFSETDYQSIITEPKAPEWAKEILLKGGFTKLPEPRELSEKAVRLMALLVNEDRSQPPQPMAFRNIFLNRLSNGQPAIDWAEQHAPELLDPPADDPLASERLLRRWLAATKADPGPFLIEAVEANNPSLVELLLPADPATMGHALLLAMTHANCLTWECCDFLLYRGCITDDIRGKGLPEGYLEVASAIVMLLRNRGARDFTLLAKAAREGDLEAMHREIDGGTPVNFTCDGWGSPLLAAITGGHLAAVEYLLAAGADPNLGFDPGILDSRDRDCLKLPLVAAVQQGNLPILRSLMAAGAVLHGPQMEKSTLFESGSTSREIAEIIFESPLPLLRNEEGNTCAHLLDEESLRLCQDLIPATAWNTRNKAGQTPLMNRITSNSSMTAFLLAAGASPNEYSSADTFLWEYSLPSEPRIIALTPLHAAIAAGDIVLVELLLEHGGDFELPAFSLAGNPPVDAMQRLRDILDEFQPSDLPLWERDFWRHSFEQQCELDLCFDEVASAPALTRNEITLLCHYLAEDPSRAALHPDLITPLSCLYLAKFTQSPLITETVDAGRKLPAVSFFSIMREEIDLKISEYREILRNLEDSSFPKPFVYPYMKEMRKLELTIGLRIWEETGTLPATSLNRDAAMQCLRFATAEFFDGFADAIEHVEADGEASMEDLGSVLAENLNPGSTIDLGKFFSRGLCNLRRLDDLCLARFR